MATAQALLGGLGNEDEATQGITVVSILVPTLAAESVQAIAVLSILELFGTDFRFPG